MNSESRIIWVDALKGIGITMVSVGHFLMGELPLTHWLLLICCTINMPPFYFVAGYFSRPDGGFHARLRRNVRTLLVPYFAASFLFFLLKAMKQVLCGADPAYLADSFAAIFLQLPDTRWEGAFWFVPSFFLAKTLFEGYLSIIRNKQYLLMAAFGFAGLAWVYTMAGGVRLMWNLEASLLVQPLFAFGYLWRSDLEQRFDLVKRGIRVFCDLTAVFVYASVIIWSISHSCPVIDFHERQLNGFFLTYLLCAASVYLLMRLLKLIRHESMLSWVGKNSLIYYLYGGLAGAVSSRLLTVLGLSGVGLRFVVNILGLYFLTVPVVLLLNHFFPWAAGKKVSNHRFKIF